MLSTVAVVASRLFPQGLRPDLYIAGFFSIKFMVACKASYCISLRRLTV